MKLLIYTKYNNYTLTNKNNLKHGKHFQQRYL
mgnify:CR=1 FL=1|jgi:hypothetical protein